MPIRHHRPATRVLAAAVLAGAAITPAWAQDEGGDPGVVVTRVVNPRIAYRGIPTDELPVGTKATTFPSQVFGETLGTMLDQLGGDELVQQHGTAGWVGGVGNHLTAPGMLPTAALLGADSQGAVGRVPIGPGASVGGAVSGITGGLGDRIGEGMLKALVPTVSLQGDGP